MRDRSLLVRMLDVRARRAGLEAEGLSPRLEMLDVRDDASVTALAQALGERHGGVDIVLSNAAARIFPQVPADQQVRTFVDTNNHGTLRMIKGSGRCSTTASSSSW